MNKTNRRWLHALVVVALLTSATPARADREPVREVTASVWSFWLDVLRPIYELWVEPTTTAPAGDLEDLTTAGSIDELRRAQTMDPDG